MKCKYDIRVDAGSSSLGGLEWRLRWQLEGLRTAEDIGVVPTAQSRCYKQSRE